MTDRRKERMKKEGKFYFGTRDLVMMAALAALGGVASTYINFIGDFFQSLLGFAGTTQWAAGLHVIWIMLAVAIVGKPGAATATGILKGFVEFLSGNTHGVLILIVDILAGLIVDAVLLFRKDKQPGLLFYLAAGLSSASNIFVFQFFASLPEDILTLFAILLTSVVAFASGVLFGGVLVKSLLSSLRKIGIVNEPQLVNEKGRLIWPAAILTTAVLLVAGAGYMYFREQGKSPGITIGGNVSNPYQFPDDSLDINEVEVKIEQNSITRSYTGFPIKKLIELSQPVEKIGLLLVSATDGYSFFIPLEEVYTNPNLIISEQKVGDQVVYNIVGANSSKAWVRGVKEMRVIATSQIEINGNVGNPFALKPTEWMDKMDSTYLNIDNEKVKLQGIALRSLWQYAKPNPDAEFVLLKSSNQSIEMKSKEFLGSDDIRIFTLLNGEDMEFILGRMNGEVILRDIRSIEIK